LNGIPQAPFTAVKAEESLLEDRIIDVCPSEGWSGILSEIYEAQNDEKNNKIKLLEERVLELEQTVSKLTHDNEELTKKWTKSSDNLEHLAHHFDETYTKFDILRKEAKRCCFCMNLRSKREYKNRELRRGDKRKCPFC